MNEIKFYSVPKTAKGINLFLDLFWGFHDFRIFEVHYYPEKDCIDLILEYDTDKLKVLLRFEDSPYMNFTWQDFKADWMFGASVFFDEYNRFVWLGTDEYNGKKELPEGVFWIKSKNLLWTIVDNEGKPRNFSFKELHPGWIKKREIESGEYEINESLYSGKAEEKTQFVSSFCRSVSITYKELLKDYPPKFTNRTKAEFYKAALVTHKDCPGNLNAYQCLFDQNLKKDTKLSLSKIEIKEEKGFFNYIECNSSENNSVWYLNFADSNLFAFYGSNLFAQDEIQTLEHPLLCSLREYLLKNKMNSFEPKTVYLNRAHGLCYPTPVLIENVPYWISVDTKPVLDDGNIGNLYGNNFSYASEEELAAGIQIFEGDIKSNIIAVAALSGGSGAYTKKDIEFTLETVLAAFHQARFISQAHNELSEDFKVSIHTGNWGCGVFGGNREFMYLVQMIAASATEIDELFFHAVDKVSFAQAKEKFALLKDMTFEECVNYLLSQNYIWGHGDGN